MNEEMKIEFEKLHQTIFGVRNELVELIDQRVDALETRMDHGFEHLSTHVAEEMKEMKGEIDGVRNEMKENQEKTKQQIAGLGNRLDHHTYEYVKRDQMKEVTDEFANRMLAVEQKVAMR